MKHAEHIENQQTPDVWSPAYLAEKLGISRTTLWRLQTEGVIPRPLRISARRIGWQKSTIQNWLATREVA